MKGLIRDFLSLLPRFVDLQRPATQATPGDRCGGLVCLARIGHLHERKTSGPSGFFVGHDIDAFHDSVGFEQGSQFLLSRAEREIANVKILHSISSWFRVGGSEVSSIPVIESICELDATTKPFAHSRTASAKA